MDKEVFDGNYSLGPRNNREGIEKIIGRAMDAAACQKKIKRRIKKQITDSHLPASDNWEALLFRLDIKYWNQQQIQTIIEYLNSVEFQQEFSQNKLMLFFWLNTTGLENQPKKNLLARFFSSTPTNLLPFIKKQVDHTSNMLFLDALPVVEKDDIQNWFSNHCHDTESYLHFIHTKILHNAAALRMATIENILLKLIQAK